MNFNNPIPAQVFQLWTEFETYKVGVQFSMKEFNRRFNLLGRVRHLNDDDPDLPRSLEGKVCVITGGSRGLGFEVAKTLLRKHCHVITGSSSSEEKIEARYHKLMAEAPNTRGKLEIWPLDLASLDSVETFIARFKAREVPLNFLVCNAGIMWQRFRLTEDKFESHLAINYVSHSLMIFNLMDSLAETARSTGEESRIVFVSSCLHQAGTIRWSDLHGRSMYSERHAYNQSKLAQVLFTYKLHRMIQHNKDLRGRVTANVLHPGICSTDLFSAVEWFKTFPQLRNMPVFRSPREGAETIIYAVLSNELKGISGQYLEDSALSNSSILSHSEEQQDRIWMTSIDLLRNRLKVNVMSLEDDHGWKDRQTTEL